MQDSLIYSSFLHFFLISNDDSKCSRYYVTRVGRHAENVRSKENKAIMSDYSRFYTYANNINLSGEFVGAVIREAIVCIIPKLTNPPIKESRSSALVPNLT